MEKRNDMERADRVGVNNGNTVALVQKTGNRTNIMDEKIYRGIGASPGIVIGRAYLLDRRKVVVADKRIGEVSVKDEVARFKKAVEVSKAQLEELKKWLGNGL